MSKDKLTEKIDRAKRIFVVFDELKALRRAFAPVLDWYDGDGERDDFPEMLADAVADLQSHREALYDIGIVLNRKPKEPTHEPD